MSAQYLGIGVDPDEAARAHYDETGWCQCTCDGCAPFGCSHKSNPDTTSCDIRFGGAL